LLSEGCRDFFVFVRIYKKKKILTKQNEQKKKKMNFLSYDEKSGCGEKYTTTRMKWQLKVLIKL